MMSLRINIWFKEILFHMLNYFSILTAIGYIWNSNIGPKQIINPDPFCQYIS